MTATIPTTNSPRPQRPRPKPRTPHRGEIWMVVSDPEHPSIGTEIWSNRPGLVISNDVINERSGFAQVVYLSSSARKRTGPTHVPVPSPDKPGDTMALCEQIHTVDASRLVRKMGAVGKTKMADVDAALSLTLSIERDPNRYGLFRKWERYLDEHGVDLAAEIRALSGQTADERVAALTSAVELLTRQRDSWREIAETSQELPDAMKSIADASSSPSA